MLTFMTAYLVVWFAVLAYMVRLGREQRRLRRLAETLQSRSSRNSGHRASGPRNRTIPRGPDHENSAHPLLRRPGCRAYAGPCRHD